VGHRIDPTAHYARSQKDMQRIPLLYLRAFASTPPARAAIARIVNGIRNLPWSVLPPTEERHSEAATERARQIEAALKRPNVGLEGSDTYSLFLSALISDLLIQNVAAVERQPGLGWGQPFWLWPVDPDRIRLNLEWTPQLQGIVPRYYDTGYGCSSESWQPLMDEDLFLLRFYASSHSINVPGPLEVAFKLIASWLGLMDFQQQTTSKATQEYMLDIGPAGQEELKAFREYFRASVLEEGQTPIIGTKDGGQGARVLKLGASTDDGLYLKYFEWLLRLIALSFSLMPRDMNITEHDNRATGEIAADTTFQFAVLPMGLTIFEGLNLGAVDFYSPGYVLQLSDTQPRDQLKEAQTSETLFESGIITQNEARLDVGKTSLGPQGDVFADGRRLGEEKGDEGG